MDNQTYLYLHKDAINALQHNHLLSALQSLQGMSSSLKAWSVKEEVDNIIDSYQILLSYFAKGANDPERHKMYKSFVRRTYELADILEREGELQNESSYYFTSLKTLHNIKGDHVSLPDMLQSQTSERDIFDIVWLSGAWTVADETAVIDYMNQDDVVENKKCLLLSAATLAAMKYFDIAKCRLLLDFALADEVKIRVRALVGLIFVHLSHPDRMKSYPEVETRLRLMLDIPSFAKQLEMLQAQLFLSLETKRIERNLQDEIIPQMMKRMKDLHIDESLGMDELKEKLTEADLNPEWDEKGQPTELSKYMHEFVELQQRGADMYMGSFKVLKQRFPFFNNACNWFWPFTMHHPELQHDLSDNKIVRMLINRTGLCDSDKYSFCLVLSQMPPEKLKMSAATLPELEESMMMLNEEADKADTFKEELRSYVQGFYRFCNLFIHREQFVNPFQQNVFLADYEPFNRLLNDDDMLLRMANFAFQDKSYDLARNLFLRLPTEMFTDSICQKLGYCCEKAGDTEAAIAHYEKANLLRPHSQWTLKRLTTCLRLSGQYEKALTHYNELAEMLPEDAHIAIHQAECLICMERYDDAFKYLFKVNYLNPDLTLATRALAWCSLVTHKYEQAEKYYQKVLQSKPSAKDFLNAGHVAWLQGNVEEAVLRYRKSLSTDKGNTTDFLDDDAHLLKAAGLTDEDLTMMQDAVSVN